MGQWGSRSSERAGHQNGNTGSQRKNLPTKEPSLSALDEQFNAAVFLFGGCGQNHLNQLCQIKQHILWGEHPRSVNTVVLSMASQ